MNTQTLLILGALGYFLYSSGALRGILGTPAPRQVPVYTSTPGGTVVTVPNVGRYATGPAGTQITLDPSFLGGIFRGTRPSTGEPLPLPETAGADTPVFPEGSSSLTWAMGGAYDAYRAGERNLNLEPGVEITSIPDPSEFINQDVQPPALAPDPCEWDPYGCAGFDFYLSV